MLTVLVVGAGALGGSAIAESGDNSYPPIVDKIAAKFNLSKDEVKKVFEEERAAHQAEHKQQLEEKLNQAVKDGKLTEEQKTKLLAKMEEMVQARVEQRQENKEEIDKRRDEFKTWANQNGIDLDEVLPKLQKGKGPHGHRTL